MLGNTLSAATAATTAMLLVSSLFLSACSGGSGNSGDDLRAQQARDQKALENLYSGVQGTWSGTVSNSASGLARFDGHLTLFVVYVQQGKNPDGTAILAPILRGKFQPNDFVTESDMIALSGAYDRSGLLTLAGELDSSAVNKKILSVRGTVAGGQMNVELSREGGVWGTFSALRTSTASSAPTAGEQTEYRERYMRIYGPVEGRYQGRMQSVNGNDYGVEIAMVIIERPMEDGGSRPILSAQYRRLDAPAGTLEWSLLVDYNKQTGEILMRENGSTGSGVPGGMILSVSGVLTTVGGTQVLDVTVRNRAAVLGNLKATRTGSAGGAPTLPFGYRTRF